MIYSKKNSSVVKQALSECPESMLYFDIHTVPVLKHLGRAKQTNYAVVGKQRVILFLDVNDTEWMIYKYIAERNTVHLQLTAVYFTA